MLDCRSLAGELARDIMRAIAFFDGVRGYLAIQDEATGEKSKL